MFEIGFWELVLIGVIALLVLGPERLPQVARTAGLWVGKARGFVRSVKSEIDRELAAEELKRTLQKQAEIPEVYDIIEETRTIARGDTTKPADRKTAPAQPAVSSDAAGGSESDQPPKTSDAGHE